MCGRFARGVNPEKWPSRFQVPGDSAEVVRRVAALALGDALDN